MTSILYTKNVSITFGSHKAVDGVSFSVKENEFKSIIGPNGAGKTTLFNLLSGQLPATEGEIYFQNQEITKHSAMERTRLGMGRSFQITNVFPNLTVLENVRLAVQSYHKVRYQMLFLPEKYKEFEDKARSWLQLVLLKIRKIH